MDGARDQVNVMKFHNILLKQSSIIPPSFIEVLEAILDNYERINHPDPMEFLVQSINAEDICFLVNYPNYFETYWTKRLFDKI